MSYYEFNRSYHVLADGRDEAITKAKTLATGPGRGVRGLIEAEQGVPGWWDVVLAVWEDTEPEAMRWE